MARARFAVVGVAVIVSVVAVIVAVVAVVVSAVGMVVAVIIPVVTVTVIVSMPAMSMPTFVNWRSLVGLQVNPIQVLDCSNIDL